VVAAFDGSTIVATFQSFPTSLTLPGGRVVPAGAVTAVTCQPTHRRQGLLTRMITGDLAASRERGEVADVLIAAEWPIYGRFGYGPATMSTSFELDATARFTQPGAGSVEFVDNATFRVEAPAIYERVRLDRAGMIGRNELRWDTLADVRRRPEDKPWGGFRVLCRDDDGVAQAWASYKVESTWTGGRPSGVAEVADFCGANPAAEARLWRFLTELDLIATVKAVDRPIDDPLPWLLADARAARSGGVRDFLWVRPLDVAALLSGRRYTTSGRVVLEIVDDQELSAGRFELDASPSGASCEATSRAVDLTVSVRALGAACLGGVRLSTLHAAGWLDEHSQGSVAVADGLLAWQVAPWCNTWF
jgi:predicted acetyltransferase